MEQKWKRHEFALYVAPLVCNTSSPCTPLVCYCVASWTDPARQPTCLSFSAQCPLPPPFSYVLPRAADSFMLIAKDRKWIRTLPNGEVYLFSLATAALMYFFKVSVLQGQPRSHRFFRVRSLSHPLSHLLRRSLVGRARKLQGWPKSCKLARDFDWESLCAASSRPNFWANPVTFTLRRTQFVVPMTWQSAPST